MQSDICLKTTVVFYDLFFIGSHEKERKREKKENVISVRLADR